MLQLVHLDLLVRFADLQQPFLILLDSHCEVVLRQQLGVYMGDLVSLCEDVASVEGLAVGLGLEDVEQRGNSGEAIDFIVRVSDVSLEDGHQIVHFLLYDEVEPVEFVVDVDVLLPLLVNVLLASDYPVQRHLLVQVVDLVDAAHQLVLEH